MQLEKYEGNPILKANPKNAWEDRCVLNPAVIYDEDAQEFVMLYRAAGNDVRHQIVFGLAKSKDGVNFTRVSDRPVFAPNHDEPEGGCVEDPRLVKFGDLYYLTYAARAYAPGQYWLEPWVEGVSKPPMYLDETDVRGEELPSFAKDNITVSYVAVTKDFRRYKKLGRITEPNIDDRDVLMFPERINGKVVLLTRPKFKDGRVKMPSIWISFTDDITDYKEPELFMTGKAWWEVQRMGAGTPPIKTEYGWFFLYHGVDKDGVYRVGAVLCDLNDPRKIIARTKEPIMAPEKDYETCGIYEGCVFPTGTVVKDGTLYVYYGCADQYVSLATCDFKKLLDFLVTECKE